MTCTAHLTKSNAGIKVTLGDGDSLPGHAQTERWIADHKFVVFRNFSRPLEEVKQWMAGFGELVRNEKRVSDHVLVLDGGNEEEVLRGSGRMPLHCDGLLMNEDVRLVGIYGVAFELEEGGQTYLSDNETVWERIPASTRELLDTNGIDIMPCDTGYYIKNDPVWYHFNGVQHRNGRRYLNAGLHYHPQEQPSYKVRIAGIDEEDSYRRYTEIEQLYHAGDLTYYHDWTPGDLLLMDNVRMMHGRQPFRGKRSIAQFQVRNKA